MKLSWPIAVFYTFLCFFASGSFSSIENFHQAFPIIEPDPGHTKLRLSREGLEAIEKITTPIAAVAVIGPYRSGKSFTLNQLLSLSCDEGFGVGHMRDTKTKGIWVWGTPVEMDINGVKTSVFYLDTEGFESIGKSNVYDDRIFALAAVMSSVLIYNLPETIREADISRLSFAVELAEEFYGRVKGQDVAFEPAKLLWLIQRDFLQGKSVQEMVDEALRRVPNSNGDKNIDQVNQIRDSLAIMGDNSTAFSLPQPHLQRTKLCDMKDAELDPLYVKKRERLKEVVTSIIRPKIVQGKSLNGKEFVSFLEQILDALNKGEIPSTGSLVEVFNKGILERCLKLYNERMAKLVLPMPGESLQKAHVEHRQAAMSVFDEQHFGRHHAKKSVDKLDEEIEKVYKNTMLANEYQSSKLCEALYTRCEDKMDHLQVLRLPSMAKFNAGFIQCNQSFHGECVGPSKINYEKRMMKGKGSKEWCSADTNPHIAVLPLHPDLRAKFNETAAWEYARSMAGKSYGYHNLIFSWIDTIDGNYPPPVDAHLVASVMTVWNQIAPEYGSNLWNEALNKRLGTQNLSLPDILVEVEKRGSSFAKLLAIPEQDDWVYSDGKSASCVAFILEMYKEGGLFGEFANSIQVTEFTIRDAYTLNLFENNSSRLPKWCNAYDTVKLPFCQIRGKYRMELPGYNSMDLYPHMNERCPSMPPKYYRPQGC